MFGGNSGISLADIAAVTRNGNGFGGDGGGWWAWIILLAMFGWGDGGFFGNGGRQGTQAEVQRGFDTSAIVSKLDGINNGICSLGYDQLAQMNGINSNIMQTGFGIQQAINADTVANMQNVNSISRQLADCCCENRAAIAQVRYDMATNTCATNTAIDRLGDRIEGRLTTMEMNNLREQNAQLRQQLNDCSRDSALQGTASYIINAVRPTAQPAYLTCNPQTGMVWPMTINGCCNPCNQGCGCGGCC